MNLTPSEKSEIERQIIRRALTFFWSCEACRKLGWFVGCPGKSDCGDIAYGYLERHFKKAADIEKMGGNDEKIQ